MNWSTNGYLSFGEDSSMNDCHNPYTKSLIDLSGYNYIYIDYAIPLNTLYGNSTNYYASRMDVCLDRSTGTDGSAKGSHDYTIGYLMNGKEQIARKTKKFKINDYNNSYSLSFSGWVSPNNEQLEIRIYNIYLLNINV